MIMALRVFAVLVCVFALTDGLHLPFRRVVKQSVKKDTWQTPPEAVFSAVLSSLLAAQIAIAPANAAIPTYDDYVGREGGSVKRQNGSIT